MVRDLSDCVRVKLVYLLSPTRPEAGFSTPKPVRATKLGFGGWQREKRRETASFPP